MIPGASFFFNAEINMVDKKYKKNPAWEAPEASVDGVVFNDSTIVCGERWAKYTKPMFPGKPAILVEAADGDVVTDWHKADNVQAKEAPRATFSTVPFKDRLKAEEEAQAKVEMVKAAKREAAKKAAKEAVKAAPKEAPKAAPKPVPKAVPKPVKEQDDLTELPAIGESRAETLVEAGLYSYKKIARTSPKRLMDVFENSGSRINLTTARSIIRAAKYQ